MSFVIVKIHNETRLIVTIRHAVLNAIRQEITVLLQETLTQTHSTVFRAVPNTSLKMKQVHQCSLDKANLISIHFLQQGLKDIYW